MVTEADTQFPVGSGTPLFETLEMHPTSDALILFRTPSRSIVTSDGAQQGCSYVFLNSDQKFSVGVGLWTPEDNNTFSTYDAVDQGSDNLITSYRAMHLLDKTVLFDRVLPSQALALMSHPLPFAEPDQFAQLIQSLGGVADASVIYRELRGTVPTTPEIRRMRQLLERNGVALPKKTN